MNARPLVLALLLGATPLVCTAAVAPSQDARQVAPFSTLEVADDGLVAAFMAPVSDGPHPAIIVLGGSEGGTAAVRSLARLFADEGYAVLALSYFSAPGLPATAEDISLEYFDRAIAWLARQPQVDPERMGIFGVSLGGEAALLIGSRSPQLHAVAAGVPSGLVWQGISPTPGAPAKSTWSQGGTPLAYLPYDPTVRFDFTRYMESIYALYAGALPAVAAHPEAVIPVERINGPVLLISGRNDAMWPSTVMSDMVVARLREKGFSHPVDHLAYENAGHAVSSPPDLGSTSGYPDEAAGGTAAGNAAGRADMWPRLIGFFDTALGLER